MKFYTKEINKKIKPHKHCDEHHEHRHDHLSGHEHCDEPVVKYIKADLTTNSGTECPGTVIPLNPIIPDKSNSIKGLNEVGINEINPHYGYNSS